MKRMIKNTIKKEKDEKEEEEEEREEGGKRNQEDDGDDELGGVACMSSPHLNLSLALSTLTAA